MNHITALNSSETTDYAEKLVDEVLMHKEKHNIAIATKAFKATEKSIMASVYKNLLEWDECSSERLSACKKPILHIQSQTPFCSEDKLKKLCDQTVTSRVFGAGHWMTLEAPEQVNAMIECFIELSA